MIIMVGGLLSCEDIDQPMTRDFTESSFWKSEKHALEALTPCYENMYTADYFFANDALSDNAYNKSTSFDGVGQIASGGYDARTARVVNEWNFHYSAIRKCNIVIANVDRISGSTPEMTQRLAEAMPDCRAVIVPGARHMLPVERPREFVDCLSTFIGANTHV